MCAPQTDRAGGARSVGADMIILASPTLIHYQVIYAQSGDIHRIVLQHVTDNDHFGSSEIDDISRFGDRTISWEMKISKIRAAGLQLMP